ncbi:MAG: PTS sugar transporter subunit IIA [Gammaproteobacteria bacterium]|nr:PTS sugar transporter subunit IIA [Gammaproteobacteria bacterium]
MNLQDIIQPDSVLCNAEARSKKHSLEILSELLGQTSPEIASEEIFENLIDRERLGCTGLDQGVAFPHCRVSGVKASSGALIKLASPVDFDSSDGELVDVVFGLIVPSELDATHYADIEELANLLRNEDLRIRLRAATSSSDLYDALIAGQHEPLPKVQESGN